MIVTCPTCSGIMTPVVPHNQHKDPLCGLCHGEGEIDNDICHCGRIVEYEKDGIKFCGRASCWRGLYDDLHKVPTVVIEGEDNSEEPLDVYWDMRGFCC